MKKKLLLTLCTVLIAFFAFTGTATAQPLPGGNFQMGWTTDPFASATIYEQPVRFLGGGNMRGRTGVYGLAAGGFVHYRLPGISQTMPYVTTTFIDGLEPGRCDSFEVEKVLSPTMGHINWVHSRSQNVTVIKNVYVFSEGTLGNAGITGVTQVKVTGLGRLVPPREGIPFIGQPNGETTVTMDYVTIGFTDETAKRKNRNVARCQYDFEPEAGITLTVTEIF